MLQTLNKYLKTGLHSFGAAVGVLLLAGCATTLSARVTTYQQWPENVQGQTYSIVASAAQGNNLEYQSFADMIRAAIGPTGLVEAQQGGHARFNVSFEYGNPVTQTWVREYNNDPFFYNGFGTWGGGYYGHGGWGGGIFYTPAVVAVPVQAYKNTLTVIIKDNNRQGAEVYRSSAISITSVDNLVRVMPYLARAVFDGFPGNNGQVRDVTYEMQR